ncbi:LacI family DNA-binding transcriptional regulator [Saccharospirillum mangrovi]|uniref:LacI family DNA-binding transcriptional regulator n=1 Tax=Saccharospirillum mangrovi TaxID=2161747 RepID=UPI000D344B31|nr:LacI family DNA-binding transcriptional regulator [Saccharospirillum mangrovi]
MQQDRPANRRVTATDVAKRAGVSRSAVSRTFTAGASVSPKTRERIMTAAQELGYRVNMVARGMMKRTHLVGLVVSDLDNSFRASLVDALARRLVAMDFHPFMLPTDRDQNIEQLIDMMLRYNVTGAIVTSDTSPTEITQACADFGVPLVLVNKPRPNDLVATVTLDADQAGRLAAEALAEAGCRDVAIASQRRASYSIDQRKAAFVKHCQALNLTCVGDFQGAAQNYHGGIEAAQAMADRLTQVQGVFCVNDYLALGFMDWVRHHTHRRIPEDLAVVGCDDIDQAAWQAYDLTTIRQDTDRLAEATLAALVARIDAPTQAATHPVIDAQLVRRGSTARSGAVTSLPKPG